jgi:hypothetical protein
MMLVKGNSDYEAGKPPSPELMEAIGALAEKSLRDGTLLDQGGLLPSSAGALIRVKGGKIRVVDGPFSEAREVIGGYAILKADSRAEAIRMGSEFMALHAQVLGPSFEGELEVREMFDPPPGAGFRQCD